MLKKKENAVESTKETKVKKTRTKKNVESAGDLTPEEQETLQAMSDELKKEKDKVSIEKMSQAVALVESEFNLTGKNFSVTSFKDSGSKCVLSISNDDFSMSITIANPEKYGLI